MCLKFFCKFLFEYYFRIFFGVWVYFYGFRFDEVIKIKFKMSFFIFIFKCSSIIYISSDLEWKIIDDESIFIVFIEWICIEMKKEIFFMNNIVWMEGY